MALAETAELVAELNLKGDFQRKATAAQRQLRGLDKDSSKLKAAFGKMGKGASQAFHTLAKGATVAGVAVLALGGKTLSWAADFEEQLGKINTVAKVTPKELDAIGDSLKGLAESTGASLDDLSAAYYDLVSAGVDAADAQNVLTQANKLAIGGLSTTEEAVDLLTTAINSYGLDASEAAKITDGFAQSIAAGKVTASELAKSFARVAPIAAAAGIGIDELQAAYAQMTAQGVPAAETATTIRSAIVALQKPTKAMAGLQEDLNVDFEEMARDKGLAETYALIRREADRQGISMVTLTGRLEGTQYALAVTGKNAKSFRKNLVDVRNASDGAGVAAQQMAERQKGVNASLRRLKETARVTGIEFAEGLLPGAVKGFDAIAAKIKSSRRAIRSFGDTVGSIIKDFFTDEFRSGPDQGSIVKVGSPFSRLAETVSGAFDGIKNLPWGEIKENFGFVTRVAGEALRIFQSLPPEMQGALITLLAANKLTGGLVASGLKDIGGLILKSLTTIMAGNVTVIGTTVTAPGVPGVPGTPTKAPSGMGNLLKNIATLLPWVGVIAMGEESRREGEALLREQLGTFNEGQQAAGTDLDAIRENIQTVKDRAGQALERQAQQRQISGTGNDLLRGLTDDQRRTDAAFRAEAARKAKADQRSQALAALQIERAARVIPALGDVRGAVMGVTNAIHRKDLSVRVSNVTTISGVTVAQETTRVYSGNRAVIS